MDLKVLFFNAVCSKLAYWDGDKKKTDSYTSKKKSSLEIDFKFFQWW